MKKIEGIISAMVTPLDENEQINEYELRNQINRQIRAGVSGIFCLGTNGEGYILDFEEKIKVMEIVVEEVADRVLVFAGTGCIGTKETIALSQEAKRIGVDFLSVITPYFAQASQDELYTHYEMIASSVNLPIVLYNIPARTGNNLSPKLVARLATMPNIVGIKDSSGDFNNILEYIKETKNQNFSVISGNDSLIFKTLMAGGVGGISAVTNVLPEMMVEIYKKWLVQDYAGAEQTQEAIRPIRECFKYGNPNTVIKIATNLMGYPVGKNRAPFDQLSKEGMVHLSEVLETCYTKYKRKM